MAEHAVSIIGLIIMVTLFLHELGYYVTTYTVHQVCTLSYCFFPPQILSSRLIFHDEGDKSTHLNSCLSLVK